MSHIPDLTPEAIRLSVTKSVIAHAAQARRDGTVTKELALLTDHDSAGPVSTYMVFENGAVRLCTKHLDIACEVYNGIRL